ncbi:MT-A70-domain-containing protein [Lasiosphaeris hirsuta]|uniref:MT-A70-domain-containing protein n=1 Tax=Lasiosphaeris hirsuta TaxID=260670 RepID=A0AA40AH47_9PEZI|nr:MT-A70-domain-containing protein [Lasiosphaeris hirsuta]
MASSILYQNAAKTVLLLDLPRSVEESQVLSRALTPNAESPPPRLRRLMSALPPATPFPTPEPKDSSSAQQLQSPSAQLTELMTFAAAESALDDIKQSYDGPWYLPRVHPRAPSPGAEPEPRASPPPSLSTPPSPDPSTYHIPPNSHPLHGTIATHRSTLLSITTPASFDLILLDPPWPNRSAKRKRRGVGAYHTQDYARLRATLSLVPVASRLADDGLVAVWLTNSARAADLLLAPSGGLFAEWGVEVVGEWTWLKVTAHGDPVVGMHDATWRRPWERLLLARKKGTGRAPVGSKVVVTVPDVHSRKPSLRGVFEELLPPGYTGLEVFARHLTAGWHCWGDEVLLFQHQRHWVDMKLSG